MKRTYSSLMAHPNNEHSTNKIIRPIPRRPTATAQQTGPSGAQPPARYTYPHSTAPPGPRPTQSLPRHPVPRQEPAPPPPRADYNRGNSGQQQIYAREQQPSVPRAQQPSVPRAQQPSVARAQQTLASRGHQLSVAREHQSTNQTIYPREQQFPQQTLNDRWQQPPMQTLHARGQEPHAVQTPGSSWQGSVGSVWRQVRPVHRQGLLPPAAHPPPATYMPPGPEPPWQRETIATAAYPRTMQEGPPDSVDPVAAQQPYGNPATPYYHHDNRPYQQNFTPYDSHDYQPNTLTHSNQMHYDYDPFSNHGNAPQHGADAQVTQKPREDTSRREEVTVTAEERVEWKPVADKTMKVITATIEGMKHWAQYKHTAPLMFQLIGRVDSAVTTDVALQCHRFVLSDHKDSMETVFYVIDRQMPQVVRGQVYRCVGKLTSSGERFHCLTLRPAGESERRLHKATVAACDKHMRHWVRLITDTQR